MDRRGRARSKVDALGRDLTHERTCESEMKTTVNHD